MTEPEGKAGKKLSRHDLALIAVVAAAIIIAVALVLATAPPTSASNEAGADLQDRAIGSGAADFWAVYPPANPKAQQSVEHPDWVSSAVASGPVMILVHQEGCIGCSFQEPVCDRLASQHAGNLTYFSLLGGRDDQRIMQAIAAYDPDGGAHYVPLTVVVTERMVGNETVMAFHSWEGVIGEQALQSWLTDAIGNFPAA
jgi:hypothetical protein